MIRDELQVVLNDVEAAVTEAAEGHAKLAGELRERSEPRAADLDRLADERRVVAEALGDRLRALGDRPREGDAEYQSLLEMFTRLRASFAENDVETLLEERAEAEARIVEAVDTALDQDDLPDDLVTMLSELRDQARRAAGELGGSTA